MRPKTLAHPSNCRTLDNPLEIERLLSQGWVLAAPKPRTKDAKRMRTLRHQRRLDGWLSVYFWLSPEDVAAVTAIRRPGESYAALLVRLVTERSLML